VVALNQGAGREAAEVTFYSKAGVEGDTSGSFEKENVIGSRLNVTVEQSKVEVAVLDEFIREHVGAGEAIPLVKMDVEGHEQAVKVSARRRTARSGRPRD